jgi:8-oxo-dGTP pyrophosphatase MutT (NUDIX family)
MTPRITIHHEPIAGATVKLGVGVILRDGFGRVLLEKRSDNGEWGLPGGRLDPGETIDSCARREVREETGLECRVVALQGVYSDPAAGRMIEYHDNGDRRHLVDVVVIAEVISGTLVLSSESEAMEWFDPAAFPAPLIAPSRAALADYAAGRSGVVR